MLAQVSRNRINIIKAKSLSPQRRMCDAEEFMSQRLTTFRLKDSSQAPGKKIVTIGWSQNATDTLEPDGRLNESLPGGSESDEKRQDRIDH